VKSLYADTGDTEEQLAEYLLTDRHRKAHTGVAQYSLTDRHHGAHADVAQYSLTDRHRGGHTDVAQYSLTDRHHGAQSDKAHYNVLSSNHANRNDTTTNDVTDVNRLNRVSYTMRKKVRDLDNVYSPYPPSQPFIYDDYRRDAHRPIIAYPESNREGIVRYTSLLLLTLITFHYIL